LQAPIDELDFNATVAAEKVWRHRCKLGEQQFLRAINEGSVSLLRDNIRVLLLDAYSAIGVANAALDSRNSQTFQSESWAESTFEAQRLVKAAHPKIIASRNEL
jgi:hypothetical protein